MTKPNETAITFYFDDIDNLVRATVETMDNQGEMFEFEADESGNSAREMYKSFLAGDKTLEKFWTKNLINSTQ